MKLYISKWHKENLYIIHSTPQLFKTSDTFARDWKLIDQVEVKSPYERPIPLLFNLYVAERSEQFPYMTTNIRKIENLFTPLYKGVYFLADQPIIDYLKRYGYHII
jgi:hypothetical protein